MNRFCAELAIFYWLLFGEVCLENSCGITAKLADFSANLSLKIPWNWLFLPRPVRSPVIGLRRNCLLELIVSLINLLKPTFPWMKTRSFVLKFNPQKAENRILGLWNVKISHSRTRLDPVFPPKRRGLTAPCWYSRLLDSNLLATSIFIETPGYVFELKQQYSLLCYLLSSETWGQLTWIALTDKSSHQCPLFLVLALPSPCMAFSQSPWVNSFWWRIRGDKNRMHMRLLLFEIQRYTSML